MTTPNETSVGTEDALVSHYTDQVMRVINDMPMDAARTQWGVDACEMLRDLIAERDALAGRVAELEAERDKLQTAAMLVLAWYEAEENHGDTTFMQRVEMCRESEDALRAALKVPKGGV